MAISACICILLTAMKRDDEALNTSSLQVLRSVKHFIATNFYPALNASSLLLFKGTLKEFIASCFIAVSF
jgi:hypothetical protein